MSTTPVLKADIREESGSAASRRARREGRIPANLYGHGEGNTNLSLDAHDLELALAGPSQLFTLKLPQGDESCLVKEVQYDTFGQRVLHVDFARIDLSEEVHVEVHIEFRGTPKGANDGGDPLVLHAALPVKCRADAIPDEIRVDVAKLEIGEQVHAKDLQLPPGVSLDDHEMDPDEAVYAVAAPRVEEEPEEDEGDEAAGEVLGADAEEQEGSDEESDDDKKPDEEG